MHQKQELARSPLILYSESVDFLPALHTLLVHQVTKHATSNF